MWFAAPYVALRVVGLGLYSSVLWVTPEGRKAITLFATLSIGGLAAVLMGAYAGEQQVMFWALAIFLDVIAALIAGGHIGWGLHPEHFAERHGLIVIIALGESLIVAAGGLSGAERSGDLLLVGFLAVAITCGLWWTYFPVAKPELEHALTSARVEDQARVARDSYSLGHFPMMCGIIAYAIAIEEAVAHPSDALPTEARVVLAIGLLLFVGGLAIALWRASCSFKWTRVIISLLTAAAILALTDVSAVVSLGLAFVGVALVAFLEEKTAERMQAAA